MKTLFYFSLLVVLILVDGCKKEQSCDGVSCFAGKYYLGATLDTFEITVINGALSIPARSQVFQNTGNNGREYTYTCASMPGYIYTELVFHNPAIDDSIYYHYASHPHVGTWTDIYRSGIKIQ